MAVRNFKSYKHQRSQNKAKPATNLSIFCRNYGMNVASRILDYSPGALYNFLRDGAPIWVENRARELLDHYAELKETGRVPEMTREQVANPDRFTKVMIKEFPDTAMGRAMKEAYEAAKAKHMAEETPEPEVVTVPPVEEFIQEVLRHNRLVEDTSEDMGTENPQPQETPTVQPQKVLTPHQQRFVERMRAIPLEEKQARAAAARDALRRKREAKKAAQAKQPTEPASKPKRVPTPAQLEAIKAAQAESVRVRAEQKRRNEAIAEMTQADQPLIEAEYRQSVANKSVAPSRAVRLLRLATDVIQKGLASQDKALIHTGQELLGVATEMLEE
jgi:hypothetical protein